MNNITDFFSLSALGDSFLDDEFSFHDTSNNYQIPSDIDLSEIQLSSILDLLILAEQSNSSSDPNSGNQELINTLKSAIARMKADANPDQAKITQAEELLKKLEVGGEVSSEDINFITELDATAAGINVIANDSGTFTVMIQTGREGEVNSVPVDIELFTGTFSEVEQFIEERFIIGVNDKYEVFERCLDQPLIQDDAMSGSYDTNSMLDSCTDADARVVSNILANDIGATSVVKVSFMGMNYLPVNGVIMIFTPAGSLTVWTVNNGTQVAGDFEYQLLSPVTSMMSNGTNITWETFTYMVQNGAGNMATANLIIDIHGSQTISAYSNWLGMMNPPEPQLLTLLNEDPFEQVSDVFSPISGTDGSDNILGSDNMDFISGGLGQDTLNGSANDDLIDGGEDGDILIGESGADILRGGEGADVITGGSENDIFMYRPGDGGLTVLFADMITDFEQGSDQIGLSGSLTFNDVVIDNTSSTNSVVSTTSGEFLVVVSNVSGTDLNLDSTDFTEFA